jgi:homocysteine S-methyltransferase
LVVVEGVLNNPLLPFLTNNGTLVLDGGLATELERYGFDLGDELWSARLLKDAPEAIRRVHLDYLAAGADCIISASYQATIAGFMGRGMSEGEAIDLINLSVQIAGEARDGFWAEDGNRLGRIRPIVAASVGPYGATLADGSEYTGNYDLDTAGLYEFHRHRWQILARSSADILACETIPSYPESKALARLLAETPERAAWFSFSCQDGQHIADGTPLVDCVRSLNALHQVAAVGINCTAPRHIPGLLAAIREATDKPIVVYPNSGERYDADNKRWLGESIPSEFGTYSREWRKMGATLIGGCCRTGPAHIRQIRDRMDRGKKPTTK